MAEENPRCLSHLPLRHLDKSHRSITEAQMYSQRDLEFYRRRIAEAHRAIEFLQEDLKLLQGHSFTASYITTLDENLKFTRSFLIQETPTYHHQQPKYPHYVHRIRSEVGELLEAADACVRDVCILKWTWNLAMEIRRLPQRSQRFHSLVKEIRGVYEDYGFWANGARGQEFGNSSRESNRQILMGDTVVGFDDEALALLDRLIGGSRQLEVNSIVGMAGIGKTTLTKKLYNEQKVVYHFHIRAWVSVSQVYKKTNILSSILSSILQKDLFSRIKDHEMGENLYKCLKGYRYLIVIDDIWDIGIWNDIKMYFPNDGNKSRILITTRIKDVAMSFRSNIPPHCLRFLSPEESWHLFTHKVFADKICPHELMQIGKRIVAKCKGLPLAIVVVAGLLKKQKTQGLWTRIANNIGPFIDSDTKQIMDILVLSYEHLPQHLKVCFLYLGRFPEDYEIPIKQLLQLWIAEGFIQQIEGKRLEDLAEDYLMELIDRSLVIFAKKRSIGGTKTCHIHDMFRELCLMKAKEEKFLIMPVSPISSDTFEHKYLRVLDIRQIIYCEFPLEILNLYHLKYLALQVEHIKILPRGLSMLWNLKTFILQIDKGRRIVVPFEIWKMEKLRHIDISSELEFEQIPTFNWILDLIARATFLRFTVLETIWGYFDNSLYHLQTISHLCPSGSAKNTLARTPNLRKLGFYLAFSDKRGWFSFPDLASLKLLESMKFEYQTLGMKSIDLPPNNKFPPSLRKLTLIGSHVKWEQMSLLGTLPNLEVLKIKDNFFSGPMWETSADGFRCLKFLKLSHVDLQQWITSEGHFPRLEQLVLNSCFDLVEIPSTIGDICTLQVIKVYRSSSSVANSAWQIQESQRSFGNDEFKVFFYPQFEENISSVRTLISHGIKSERHTIEGLGEGNRRQGLVGVQEIPNLSSLFCFMFLLLICNLLFGCISKCLGR